MKSYYDLEQIFSRKMLEIPQVFLRFFMKKSVQSLVIFLFKHLKLKRFGYRNGTEGYYAFDSLLNGLFLGQY